MNEMKVMIVGGDFDADGGRPSGVVAKLAMNFSGCDYVNGGEIYDVEEASRHGEDYDLVIWMPNISNAVEKIYPRKKTGATLICSKVFRDGYTPADILQRVYAMQANAVIIVISDDAIQRGFELVDALGNSWTPGAYTESIPELAAEILMFTKWSSSQVRWPSVRSDSTNPKIEVEAKFVNLVQFLAEKYESVVGRWFGNASTRCFKMFPSKRITTASDEMIAVSPRNIDKASIGIQDFVAASLGLAHLDYYGDHKPSVDACVQASLYERRSLRHINYMIHGHTYVKSAPTTREYFPCGDLREVESLVEIMSGNQYGVVNLKNHGCLYYADTLDNLAFLVGSSEFEVRGGPGMRFESVDLQGVRL